MNLISNKLFFLGLSIFTIGACLGSFLKLVVDRYNTKESFIFKPSCCTSCKKNLAWWQNIPVLSYLILRGKCFYCKSKIDVYLFYSELITALTALMIFLSTWQKKESLIEILSLIAFAMVLVLLSMFDLKHRIIPHTITYSAIIFITIFRPYISFINLGIAFLFMDFLYVFSTMLKKFKLDINLISLSLIIWSFIFIFNQNIYFAIIAAAFYFFTTRIKLPAYISTTSWIVLFFLILSLFYKMLLKENDITKLFLYFAGVGIIYFICEIVAYFLSLFFPSKETEHIEKKESLKITLGGGDITVFALISVFLGYKVAFLTLFIASLLAIISHFTLRAILKLSQNSETQEYIPFVPFLSIASFLFLL